MRILFALLCTIVFACGAATEFEARRVKSQNTALTLYPEVADPRSRIGAEVERLVAEYEAAKDEVLFRDDAPLVITQRAAERVVGSITVQESEKDALRLFPDLALADSPLKKLFSERQEALRKANHPTAFKNPRWPVLLAFECAVALDPARLPGATPRPDEGENPAAPTAPATPATVPSPTELPSPENPNPPAGKPPTNAPDVANPPIAATPPPPTAPPPANATAPGNPATPQSTPAVTAPKPPRVRKPAPIGANPSEIGEPPPAAPPAETGPPPTAKKPPQDADVQPAPAPNSPNPVTVPQPTPAEPPSSAETPAIQEIDPIPKKAASRKTEKSSWTKIKTQVGPYITASLAFASLVVFVTWLKRQRG